MSQSINERQRQMILYYWEEGICEAPKIQSLTKIPMRTIYYNLKKIRQKGDVMHRGGNGRKKIITNIDACRIGQYVRRNPTISTKLIASKLKEEGTVVSRVTVGRYLAEHSYKNSLPLTTPMLIKAHKEIRITWTKNHLHVNWKRTIFTDETSFQLFRNTIKHWHKGVRPIRPMPKDRRKIMAWGGFCAKGKTSLLPEIRGLLGDRWRFQQDNDPKHTSRTAKDFETMVLDWPSNSPDLNPIENLWNIVKTIVERRKPKNWNGL